VKKLKRRLSEAKGDKAVAMTGAERVGKLRERRRSKPP
jgi:hypothetical protein